MSNAFSFKVTHNDVNSKARTGIVTTPHGDIQTPAFVPVGTQATVKSLTPAELEDLDVELFFVNTYHVFLRPGMEVIKKAGGLHSFMGVNSPIITDSGGFQVFSLGRKKYTTRTKKSQKDLKSEKGEHHTQETLISKIDEDGVTFQSHWDGSLHTFSPEVSMQAQWDLGSDIHIAFDECPPFPCDYAHAQQAMERTHRWAVRSLEEHKRVRSSQLAVRSRTQSNKKTSANYEMPTANYQALYGVVQGSVFEDLRIKSADFISAMDFDGIAIGGVAVGEGKNEMRQVCDWVVPRLPDAKPRHLLGVGEIDDIFEIVERGVDTFDCVQPTRLARMGRLFSRQFAVGSGQFDFDITRKEYAQDMNPIDDQCDCYVCQNFTRAYLHHLFRVKELLAYRLATLHNIKFLQNLINKIRFNIQKGTFLQFKREFFTI